ncbi:MAG: hypothetical protein ACOC40_00955 [Thermoplasmatota archaeon]
MIENELTKRKDIKYNPYARKIMLECFRAPKSLQEISRKHDIPKAEIYLIASKLEKIGLITPIDKMIRNGKSVSLYKTTTDEVFLEKQKNGLKMKMNFEGEKVKMIETAV